MRPDVDAALADAMATMVRTTDGRAVRHAVRRLDEALGRMGMGVDFRQTYVNACRSVADTIAQRAPTAKGARAA